MKRNEKSRTINFEKWNKEEENIKKVGVLWLFSYLNEYIFYSA